MELRRGQLIILPLVILTLFLVGCPKRPATTTAGAPAPGGPGAGAAPEAPGAPTPGGPGAGATPGAPSAPGAGVPGTGAPGRAAAPQDFVSIGELKDVHFDFDKYNIRPGDAKILDDNAKWMKANQRYLILIEGHCDERGTTEYNLALGERRAKSTMNYLVAQGIQASRISIISYGKERPLCTERTEECWARNRRAHLLVKAQ